jgi:hypothetical protein
VFSGSDLNAGDEGAMGIGLSERRSGAGVISRNATVG